MKKALTLTILALFLATSAYAAGACTPVTPERSILHGAGTSVIQLVYDCVADDSDGSFPAVTISDVGGSLTGVYVDDGTTGVTDSATDITVKIADTDIDLLGGEGEDMVITTPGYVILSPVNTRGDQYLADFSGDLTMQISGNSVNEANPRVVLTFRP